MYRCANYEILQNKIIKNQKKTGSMNSYLCILLDNRFRVRSHEEEEVKYSSCGSVGESRIGLKENLWKYTGEDFSQILTVHDLVLLCC